MPGWNGAGTFVLPYSMVAEAAAGVKILASHQDTQWNAVKAGLELCQTRDGQNSPSADINWGGFKITNLGAPVSNTDAATKGYVGSNTYKEWIAETSSVAFVSTTSFKVLALDQTAAYHAGRRLKIVHNTGGTTSYATVVSSSFSTDTTVVVATDTGAVLVSTVTAVSYGLLSYTNPAYLDPRSFVRTSLSGSQAYAGPSASIIHFNVASSDALSEFDTATYKFTALHPGYYQVIANVVFTQTGTGQPFPIVNLFKNGSIVYQAYNTITNASASYASLTTLVRLIPLIKGDYLQIGYDTQLAGNVTSGLTAGSSFDVARIA